MTPFWAPSENVRKPQYAGSWYEKNPDKLKTELDEYLDAAKTTPDESSAEQIKATSEPITDDLLAIIVPHAGYMFSGATAAFAYKSAKQRKVERVFLLGPSHHIGFRGAAVPEAEVFATPLGDLHVDKELVNELKTYPMFSTHVDVHRVEHSLELQLPFIKHCFGDAKIVPIVIGQLNGEADSRLIGEVLKRFITKDDLVVVSSDFTHYGPRYDYTPFGLGDDAPSRVGDMDGIAFSLLSDLDLEGFVDFLDRTGDTICGMYPCQVLLSMLPPSSHGTLLKYATSRDSHIEDKNNSVSYLAIAFSGAEWAAESADGDTPNFTDSERENLLKLAKGTIWTYVKEKRCPTPIELGVDLSANTKTCRGVFVTINKKPLDDSEHKRLRGCIGSIYPTRPLHKAVQENAIAACSRDPRFGPVTHHELDELMVDVNVLTPPKRVASYNDIVIGRDGVILSKGAHQAVFLPQVAVEWNWTLEQMLTELSLKAGLGRDDWRSGCHFDVFQSEEIH